jgi:hypothetical protein
VAKPTITAGLKETISVVKGAAAPVRAATYAGSVAMVTTRDREAYNAYHRDRRAAQKLNLTVAEYRAKQKEDAR